MAEILIITGGTRVMFAQMAPGAAPRVYRMGLGYRDRRDCGEATPAATRAGGCPIAEAAVMERQFAASDHEPDRSPAWPTRPPSDMGSHVLGGR